MNNSGKVWIAGAGPGDANLITLKVLHAMEEADVIVYDALVSLEVLSMIDSQKEWIYVGKRMNHHMASQDEINQILVREAKKGKKVLRLKGGDPFVFGRGGEEVEALLAEEIEFEVIPGITSAVSVPAYAGIPVTHRDRTSSFHVITGHPRKGGTSRIDYDSLVRLGGTLIFLMGISSMGEICNGLIEAGMPKDMPAAVVEKGTTAFQRKVVSTVANLEQDAKKEAISMPAIILIGKVCELSDAFSWVEKRTLSGRQIIVTRPKERIKPFADALRRKGAQVIEFPVIKTQDTFSKEAFMQSLDRISKSDKEKWIVFTSPAGVRSFFEKFKVFKVDLRTLFLSKGSLKFAVIGSGTKAELAQYGILADYMPDSYSAADLGNGLAKRLGPENEVYILRAKKGSDELLPPLLKSGAQIEEIGIYETVAEDQPFYLEQIKGMVEEQKVSGVTFTSSSTVEKFVDAMGQVDLRKLKAICIGKQTEETAKSFGMQTITADEATMESMIKCMEEQL